MKQATGLINAAEAARILGVHRTTVFRMTREGRLPAAQQVQRIESYYDPDVVAQIAAARAKAKDAS